MWFWRILLSKDVKALAYFGSEGNKMAMQESIIEVNKNQPTYNTKVN